MIKTDTNSITRSIIKYLDLKRFFVSRINTQGQYNPTLKRWTYGTTVKGLPDLYASGFKNNKPLTLWIEIKNSSTKDKLRPHQKEVHEKLRASGAIVFIASDFDQFQKWFESL
jgi:hypothetical protein